MPYLYYHLRSSNWESSSQSLRPVIDLKLLLLFTDYPEHTLLSAVPVIMPCTGFLKLTLLTVVAQRQLLYTEYTKVLGPLLMLVAAAGGDISGHSVSTIHHSCSFHFRPISINKTFSVVRGNLLYNGSTNMSSCRWYNNNSYRLLVNYV